MISGSFGELKALINKLHATGTNMLPKASRAMQSAVAEQYARDFAQQRSPFGDQWPANRSGGRTGFRTGALAGTMPTLSANVVRMRPPRYWSFFQAGAPTRDDGQRTPRPVLPFGPSRWDEPVEAKIRATIETYFGGDK